MTKLSDATMAYDFIREKRIQFLKPMKIGDIWNDLPVGENAIKEEGTCPRRYRVAGITIPDNVTLLYAEYLLNKHINSTLSTPKEFMDAL